MTIYGKINSEGLRKTQDQSVGAILFEEDRSPYPANFYAPAGRIGCGMILVTGANGFVGKALIQRFVTEGQVVRATVRTPAAASALRAEHPQVEVVVIGDIGPATVWDEAVRSADAVVHLASRARDARDRAGSSARFPRREYRRQHRAGVRAGRGAPDARHCGFLARKGYIERVSRKGAACRLRRDKFPIGRAYFPYLTCKKSGIDVDFLHPGRRQDYG